MPKNEDVLVPKSIILRWLQESADVADFENRLNRYVASHSNWTTGD